MEGVFFLKQQKKALEWQRSKVGFSPRKLPSDSSPEVQQTGTDEGKPSAPSPVYGPRFALSIVPLNSVGLLSEQCLQTSPVGQGSLNVLSNQN